MVKIKWVANKNDGYNVIWTSANCVVYMYDNESSSIR